jgi:hypothetical protein
MMLRARWSVTREGVRPPSTQLGGDGRDEVLRQAEWVHAAPFRLKGGVFPCPGGGRWIEATHRPLRGRYERSGRPWRSGKNGQGLLLSSAQGATATTARRTPSASSTTSSARASWWVGARVQRRRGDVVFRSAVLLAKPRQEHDDHEPPITRSASRVPCNFVHHAQSNKNVVVMCERDGRPYRRSATS